MEIARPAGESVFVPSDLPRDWNWWSRGPVGWLLGHLYTSNPFYCLSAALVMVGLHVMFFDHDAAADPHAVNFKSWVLLAVLGGYATLLAVTGCVIVRLGQVWDDARTILLTLLLLVVAMSVSFDKLVLTHSATLARVLAVGLVFAIVLIEGLLRGLPVRLPWLFRVPMHLLLGLFFVVPALLNHLLDVVGDGDPKRAMELTLWGIFLFPSVAAVIALALLPAVWCGAKYVANNGSPWAWPWYPWSIFAFLGAGVVLRSYWLTLSFHAAPGVASAFGVYFLVPLVLSACVLALELGRSARRPAVERAALVVPLPLLVLSLPGTGHSGVFAQFLDMYMERAGSPVMLAWWGLLVLYAYAWLRRVQFAEVGLALMLAIGTVIGPETVNLVTLRFPAAWPLGVATAVLFVQAIRHPCESARWFAACVAGILCGTTQSWGRPFVAWGGVVPFHLLLMVTLGLSLLFQDAFARLLRKLASLTLVATAVLCLVFAESPDRPPAAYVLGYLMSLSTVAWGYWFLVRGRLQLIAAALVTGCWFGKLGLLAASSLRRLRNPVGAVTVLAGAASFVVAVAISLMKARRRDRSQLEQ